MKAYIEQLLRDVADSIHGRNLLREYLQARILENLQRAGAMAPLAFHGGTALRFLYAMPRFSEDLDFALERPQTSYDFRAYLRAIQAEFEKEGYRVEIKLNVIDLKRSVVDVKPFLERSNEAALLSQENFDTLLGCSPG